MRKNISLFAIMTTLCLWASCSSENIVADKQQEKENTEELTTFTSGDNPSTRTSMDYTTGKFYWSNNSEYIFVKDDNNTFNSSTANSITTKTEAAKFMVPGTYTGNNYTVTYTGLGTGKANQVQIASQQLQKLPNTTDHFQNSGDCGIATATKEADGKFHFKLNHKATYLCFLPRIGTSILTDAYIENIEVTSDNDIAGIYKLSNTGLSNTPISSGSKTITLRTVMNNGKGFPLTNSATSITTNGAFMVIAPGTHALKIRYWLFDPTTNVRGTITKTIPATTYVANTIYDMTANLALRDYTENKYYMWDAVNDYWHNHESDQPVNRDNYLSSGGDGDNYPANASDPDNRWYNTIDNGGVTQASHSAATYPNVNEMIHYAAEGSPHWDDDELWIWNGHLYKGGIWIKKKAYIPTFSSSAYNGVDYRTYTTPLWLQLTIPVGQPSAATMNQYFYIPALSMYLLQSTLGGTKSYLQQSRYGRYFTSSPVPGNDAYAYFLWFERGRITVGGTPRDWGMPTFTFE